MANSGTSKGKLPVAILIAAIVLIVAVVSLFGWRAVNNTGESEKVKVDVNKIRDNVKSTGFGH